MVDWEAFYAAFRRPDFIPGYEIQNHLGGGAFGEVYKAKKRSIGKAYAVKFLRLDDAGQKGAAERELEQVRLFAAIDHPNLVTIEDMGVVEGVPYLLMGYAGEDTLARRIKRGDLDRSRAMRYFVQACRGVLALHDRRLAHFDLKPSNVFINGDVARVGDYGLAKLLTEGRQTLSFGRGTPHYMAPEMLKNRADHRADIYSLGVILFESLTFRLPYDSGGDAAPTGIGVAVRDEDRPPDFPDDFPPEVRPVVERCLRIGPEDRYPRLADVLDALGQPARQGDSVRLRSGELPEETRTLQHAGAVGDVGDDEGGASTSDDLRQGFAELTRGAVSVARGVWEGVVERMSSSPEEGAQDGAGRGAAVAALGEDVVSVNTLDEPARPDAGEVQEPAPARRDAPWRAEVKRSREARRNEGAQLLVAAPARPAGPPAGTVPVPPRAEGGWLGNVSQSVIVGTEIMGALVTGPLLIGLRSTATFFDGLLRGVPEVLGALIRLVLILVLAALAGGLVMSVLLAALAFTP